MKRVIIFIYLAIFTGTVSYSQKLFMYKENGEKVYFQEIDSLVYVKYRKEMSGEERLKFAKTVNVNYDAKNNQTDREIILIDKQNKPDFAKLKKNPTVIYANRSLIDSEGTLQVLTNKVMVKTKYNLEDILKELRIAYESYKQLGHNEHSFVIVLKTGESLEIANKLYESGYFEYAQPSFARF